MGQSVDVVHVPREAAAWPSVPRWAQLDDVCNGIFDCPHTTPVLVDQGPYVVRSQDIRSGVFRFDQAGKVSESTYKERIERAEPHFGDLLFSREGTYFGIAAEVPPDMRVCLGQRMVLIRPKREVMNTRFVRYWLNSPIMAGHVASFKDGSVAERLNMPTIRRLPVPVLERTRQDAIAELLGALDDKIELNRRMNETLEAMARAIFRDWFVDFGPTRAKMEGRAPYLAEDLWPLFPDRLDDESKPDGWRLRSVYEIADVVYGAPFSSKLFNNEGRGRPLIRIRDLPNETPGVWTPEDHPKGYIVRAGDIVVGMDGEFRAYLWGGDDAWLNQRVCAFKPKVGFSAAFVRNSIYAPLAEVEATEIATTVIHLGKNDIDRFAVTIPTEKLVEKFNDLCQPLYDRIVVNKRESRTLAATRDFLLPKLMSGEIRVRDAETLAGAAA